MQPPYWMQANWMQAIFFSTLAGALYLKPPPGDTQSNPLIAYSRPPTVHLIFVPQEKKGTDMVGTLRMEKSRSIEL